MKNWVRVYLAAVAVMVFGIVIAGRTIAAETPVVAPTTAQAAKDETTFAITIKDHIITPANIDVPADKKITLKVHNQDKTPEEFESHDLHREKIIPGGTTATILVGPLKPGVYKYFGEFNEKTAHATLTAK